MLILILIILFVLWIMGKYFLDYKGNKLSRYKFNIIDNILIGMAGACVCMCLTTVVLFGSYFSHYYGLNEKINIVKEQNTEIEKSIADVIDNYKNYESNTFKETGNSLNPSVVFTVYPELKSDKLISKQIDTYIKNNDSIRQYREDNITAKLIKFLLFFG